MRDGNDTEISQNYVMVHTSDVISVTLDADARTLVFRKNDKEIGTVEDIERGEYCAAVSLRLGDSVSFV